MFKKNNIFPLTAAVSEVCGGENATGRFLGLLSQLAETPTHQIGPGEKTPGNC